MADPSPGSILRDWQDLISQIARAVPNAALDQEIVGRLLSPLKGQLEAIQRALDQQREVQEQLVSRVFGPFDQVLGAVDDTAKAMRGQAAALRQASDSLGQVAELLDVQASLVEGAGAAMAIPTDLVGATGRRKGGPRANAKKRPPKRASS
jgi:hypothetical protein